MHITGTTVKYSYAGHPRIASSIVVGLNPVSSTIFMLNGGYYAAEGTMLIMPA